MEKSTGLVQTGGAMATRRALLAGVGIGIGALALPFKGGRALAQESEADEEIIVVGTRGDNSGMIGSPEDLILMSKAEALELSQLLLAGGIIAIVVGGCLVGTGGGGAGGIGVAGFGMFCLMLSFWLHQYALDPPQLNYKQPERLIPLQVRFSNATSAAMPGLVQIARSANVLVPTGKCMLDSVERYWGAKQASDAAWMQRKRISHDQLVSVLAFQLQQFARGAAELAASLRTGHSFNGATVRQFQSLYADDTKRSVLVQALSDIGFGPDAFAILEIQLRGLDAATVKPDTWKRSLTSLSAKTKAASAKWTDMLYRLA